MVGAVEALGAVVGVALAAGVADLEAAGAATLWQHGGQPAPSPPPHTHSLPRSQVVQASLANFAAVAPAKEVDHPTHGSGAVRDAQRGRNAACLCASVCVCVQAEEGGNQGVGRQGGRGGGGVQKVQPLAPASPPAWSSGVRRASRQPSCHPGAPGARARRPTHTGCRQPR